MSRSSVRSLLFVVSAAVTIATCREAGEITPPSPPNPTSTITVTATGADPVRIVVPLGSQVTFVNNDRVVHQMYSDPHPEHTDCPEFDSVGQLAPGEARQTTNLITARTCNFHDHLNPSNNALKGSVTIQ